MPPEKPQPQKLDYRDSDEEDSVVLCTEESPPPPSEPNQERQDRTRTTKNPVEGPEVPAPMITGEFVDPFAPDVNDEFSISTKEVIGTIIAGRYRILDLLGVGGMGSVFKAEHIMLGSMVAVKILNRDLTTNPTALKRFSQEAKAASSLKHPNIAAVSDYGLTESGSPYFVMDLIDGKSLAEIIDEKGSLPWQQAVEFGIQIADAMAFAHFQGIVHRDLKPANIIISTTAKGEERATVVDFGIAKFEHEALDAQKITKTGDVFGSPLYMSPEQCTGKTMDSRSDVYSFGCMMYEMLVGEVPFLGPTAVATIMMQLNDPPPSVRSKRHQQQTTSIPAGVDTVIKHCMEKEPSQRYSTMDAVKADLQLVKRGLSPTRKSIRRLRFKFKAPGLLQTAAVTAIGTIAMFIGMAYWEVVWQYKIVPWQRDHRAALHAIERGEYGQALLSAEHGIKIGTARHAPNHELAALYNVLGDSHRLMANAGKDDIENAKKAYEKAVALPADKHTDRQRVVAYLNLGDIYMSLGDKRAAVANYDLALSSFTEHYVDDALRARILVRKGLAHQSLNQFSAADDDFEEAVKLYREDIADTPALIDALEKRSASLKASGEAVMAKHFEDEAKGLRESF